MGNRLEKLMFTIGLIDQASGPANKIMGTIDSISKRAAAGQARIIGGAAGLFSTGYALQSLLSPSIEMSRALGEVKSLGVPDAALKQLQSTALKTSVALGTSAADIVRSAYDIQSAIAGLTGGELSAFTQAGAVLAKGTKADAATITDYMGTMYGIFQQTADQMGKAQWVEVLTGQTALAVQMFKTNGAKMAQAFANLGATATSHGIAMHEQLAILGQLQATMGGGESATKYRAFLAGVGKAQDELGLKFTDSHGRLLPMVEILQKLRGQFGNTFDVKEMDRLKKAFGSQEAVGLITNLMQNLDGLQGNINKLAATGGMGVALGMAKDIADPWERMAAAGAAIKISFGQVLQPVLVPLINKLIEGAQTLQLWTERYPKLTKLVGMATLAFLGLGAAFSVFSILGGMAKLAATGFAPMLWLLKGGLWLLKGAFLQVVPAVWGFTAALLANPITWVVLGIVALIAGLVALVVHWDAVSAAFGRAMDWIATRWAAFRNLAESNAILYALTAPLLMAVDFVGLVLDTFEKIPTWWAQFKHWLSGLDPFAVIGSGIDWLLEKIDMIPGIDIGTRPDNTLNRQSQVPLGGLSQEINNNRGMHVEKIEVNTTGGVSGFRLADEMALAAG